MNLRAKILIFIIAISVLIFSITIGYITFNSREMAFKDARKLTDSYAKQYANLVMAELNVDMDLSRTLAQVFLAYESVPYEIRNDIYNDILLTLYEENPHYGAVWTSWELSAYQPGYTKPYGRKRTQIVTIDGDVVIDEDTLNTEGDDVEELYYKIKVHAKEIITNPYSFSYTEDKEDAEMVSSIAVPIKENGQFIGLAGVDVRLKRFQDITDRIKPYPDSYAFFVANNGVFVAHPNPDFVNEEISKTNPEYFKKVAVIENIQQGLDFSFVLEQDGGNDVYICFAPVTVGKSLTPWSIGIVTPIDTIMQQADRNFFISLIVGFLGIIVLIIGTILLSNYITKPLRHITTILKKLAKGEIEKEDEMRVDTSDEIGQIKQSVNTLLEGLNRTAAFATKIGHGDLSAQFDLLSSNDKLGNALLEMRKSLKHAAEEEKQRKEEERRYNWATAGMAKFGELLRQNNDDIEEFSYTIIGNLVKYLDAHQGGIFLINSQNPKEEYIEQIATYAYNRRKFVEKRIPMGVGLIGRCIIEKESIYMTDIPDDYVTLDSGLGEASPRSLLLVPMKLNEQVFGVIELAGFNDFERYQIDFTEKIGANVASTIASVRNNMRTAQLLEASRQQSEELQQKEEEMRLNMEQMRSTQEEADRKEAEAQSFVSAVNHSLIRADFDLNGALIYANSKFQEAVEYTTREVEGKHISMFFDAKDWGNFETTWNRLIHGSRHFEEEVHYKTKTGRIWLLSTYTAVRDRQGEIVKVLCLSLDISKQKQVQYRLDLLLENARKQNRDLRQREEEVNRMIEKLKTQDT